MSPSDSSHFTAPSQVDWVTDASERRSVNSGGRMDACSRHHRLDFEALRRICTSPGLPQNCQGVSVQPKEQEDDVAKVKAETRAATVLRFKCFLLSFHPSLSLAQITLSLLCQRALRSLQAPSPLSPPSPLPFVRLPLFSSMQISFRKWKFFRDIVKTSSARRPSTARRASGGEVARSR